jgi:CDP-glycerol glycerophosphotransferase
MGSAEGRGTSDLAALIIGAGLFDAGWYGAVHADVALCGLSPEEHFRHFGLTLRRPPCPDLPARLDPAFPLPLPEATRAALRQHYFPPAPPRPSVATPAEFDEAFYLRSNPDIDLSKVSSPYEHFLRWGHRRFRNPAPDFDLVWYAHLHGSEFARPDENPFLHYLRAGKAKGYAGCPPRMVRHNTEAARPLPTAPRRACLFAAYDPHLRIDDSVLIFLRELSRHADVFYLADCEMPANELARLEGIVAGAWAQRHGAYDFGSYSLLARDLVGWERLQGYDEVLFVNDSCYLLRPLDEVLASMAARPCAWWGMQATKGLAITRESQPFPAEGDTLPVRAIDAAMLGRFEAEPVYDFHIGSYFMAFRRPVLDDPLFRQLLDHVRPEPNKFSIIRKYELGLTRLLIGQGHVFDTWAPLITRRHPVYTDVIFDLIRDGFPLFKRYLVTDNPYRVSALALWPLVLETTPCLTPLPVIKANIRRLARDDRRQANLAIVEEGAPRPEPLEAAAFTAQDQTTPKYDHYWGFAVSPDHHALGGDVRAVFEAVKDDPQLTKIIFTRSRALTLEGGQNLRCVPLGSVEGQALLMRCRHLFVAEDALAELDWPLVPGLHRIYRLAGGLIPLPGAADKSCTVAVCAAEIDRLALQAISPEATPDQIWQTGLPRHDLITADAPHLPADLISRQTDLQARLAGRRLVALCLARRGADAPAPLSLSAPQAAELTGWLAARGLVLGLWEADGPSALPALSGPKVLKLPQSAFPDREILCREAAILITDLADLRRDALLTDHPVIALVAPPAPGAGPQPETILPEDRVTSFAALLQALEAACSAAAPVQDKWRASRRALLLGFQNGGNAVRLVQRLRASAPLLSGGPSPRQPGNPAVVVLSGSVPPQAARLTPLLAALPPAGWTTGLVIADQAGPADLAAADVVVLDRPFWSDRLLDLVEAARLCGARILCDVSDRHHDFRAWAQETALLQTPAKANALYAQSAARRAAMALADGFMLSQPGLAEAVAAFGKPSITVTDATSLDACLHHILALIPPRQP